MADPIKVAAEALDAFNAHDEARMRALYSDDATLEAPGDIRIDGGDGTVAYAMAWLNAFPDARLSVHDEIAAGDWVVQRFTFSGTHGDTLHSPTGDIPATHRRLDGRGLQMMRVSGGKIAEEHLYFDQVQVMTQLGLMPEMASAHS
jgi:steroid delta-isomerase-like uncharacterized protein